MEKTHFRPFHPLRSLKYLNYIKFFKYQAITSTWLPPARSFVTTSC